MTCREEFEPEQIEIAARVDRSFQRRGKAEAHLAKRFPNVLRRGAE